MNHIEEGGRTIEKVMHGVQCGRSGAVQEMSRPDSGHARKESNTLSSLFLSPSQRIYLANLFVIVPPNKGTIQ